MACRTENSLLVFIILLVIINVVGIAIPVWHTKEHEHHVNGTVVTSSKCVVHVRIREGLWQRYCRESRIEDNKCETDVQEWCDNIEFSDYNSFVLALEILGDLTLCFVFGTIIKSKWRKNKFHLEMAAAEIGLGGLLMMIGTIVYAAADGGKLEYHVSDLHVGWGLCVGCAGLAIIVCIYTMRLYVKVTSLPVPPVQQTFPMFDDDEELISAR